jgi:galactose mutarotase-like enzyme
LEVEFSDYNHLLLWTKPNAKYICIEPWIAVPDMVDSNQNITQKPNVVIVNPKEYKSFIHTIKVI